MQGVWLYFFAGHTDGYLPDSADFLHLSVFCCFLEYCIWKNTKIWKKNHLIRTKVFTLAWDGFMPCEKEWTYAKSEKGNKLDKLSKDSLCIEMETRRLIFSDLS